MDHDLPQEIETINAVPMNHRGVYDRGRSGSLRLTHGGQQLRRVKQTLRDAGGIEHTHWFKAGKPAEIELTDWQRTMSAANAHERAALLKLKGAGRITVRT